MKTKQSGFGVVEVVIVVIIVALIGVGGWYVWNANQKNQATNEGNSQATGNSVEPTDPYAGWKDYTDPLGGFTIKYPSDWKLTTEKGEQGGPEDPTTDTYIKSPTGTEVRLAVNGGGFGGACEPAEGDKPFQLGNQCPTSEYTAAEKLPATMYSSSYENGTSVVKKADVYVVTQHIMQRDGTEIYSMGLQSAFPENPIKLNDPVMGFVIARHSLSPLTASGEWLHYVEAWATGGPAFPDSADGVTASKIFKSFRFN